MVVHHHAPLVMHANMEIPIAEGAIFHTVQRYITTVLVIDILLAVKCQNVISVVKSQNINLKHVVFPLLNFDF